MAITVFTTVDIIDTKRTAVDPITFQPLGDAAGFFDQGDVNFEITVLNSGTAYDLSTIGYANLILSITRKSQPDSAALVVATGGTVGAGSNIVVFSAATDTVEMQEYLQDIIEDLVNVELLDNTIPTNPQVMASWTSRAINRGFDPNAAIPVYTNIQHKISTNPDRAPLPADDATLGYSLGSIWLYHNVGDEVNAAVYMCQFAGIGGAANWIQILSAAGSVAWGGITGNLANQTDLLAALNLKMNISTYDPAGIAEQLVGIAAAQALTGKTVNGVVLTAAGLQSRSLREDGTYQSAAGSGDMTVAVYDPATVNEQLVGLTAIQTLTNKTLTAPAINTPTGIVKGDVGLGNVDNTSDANKPVSTAQQTALDLKMAELEYDPANISEQLVGLTAIQTLTNKTLTMPAISNPTGLDKIDVGLANVDNTSDANKPVSTAQQTALNLKEDSANKNVNNGYAPLDASALVPLANLPASVQTGSEYKGVYNATTNTPTLIDGTGANGDYYRVSVAGTQNFGAGNITFAIGDLVLYNGTSTLWQKVAGNPDLVESVAGKQGIVTLDAADITDFDTEVANNSAVVLNTAKLTNVDTNLSTTQTATTVDVVSSDGTDATLPQVIAAGNAGVMSGADKTKLDGITALADITNTATVTAAGAVMDSEVDVDIKTLVLPANTTISAFGASLVDDAAAANARTTLELGNVDNTSDANKPISTATQTGLDGKLTDIVEDITPQLGAALDTNAFQIKESKGADVISAAALPVLSDGNYFNVTGVVTITSIATQGAGTKIALQFDGILTLTHNATTLILPTGSSILTAAGDVAVLVEYATNNWKCISYARADGTPLAGGGGDMLISVYDPATVNEQVVGLTAIQTLTNKTLTAPVVNNPTGIVAADISDFDAEVANEAAVVLNTAKLTNVSTNLTTTQTATTVDVVSSDGTDATLPQAIAAGNAGVMSGADKTKLDGITALADITNVTTVTAAGALMDSEVDADIKTLVLPASTTISAFGATVIDDVDAVAARATLGVGVFDISFQLDTGKNDTFTLHQYASFGYTIDHAYYKTDSGTITANVQIDAVSVTGLAALAVTSTEGNAASTAADTVAVGDTVTVITTSDASATNLALTLHCTRT